MPLRYSLYGKVMGEKLRDLLRLVAGRSTLARVSTTEYQAILSGSITASVNIDDILSSVERQASRQGIKLEPTLADSDRWVYELETNSDLSVHAALSDNIRDL